MQTKMVDVTEAERIQLLKNIKHGLEQRVEGMHKANEKREAAKMAAEAAKPLTHNPFLKLLKGGVK